MFLVHPSDLEQRRKRCRPEVEKLLQLQRETVLSCDVCSSDQNVIVSGRDRYGLPIRTALCLNCGLFYLMDRLTAPAYSQFYGNGAYRAVSSQFNRVTHNIAQIQADQIGYARMLVRVLEGYVARHNGGGLLDVGGSAGLVAREFADYFGLQGTVLDPAADEAAAARTLGLNAVVGSIEDWSTREKFQLILLCRGIEHLISFRGALSRIRSLLHPQGLFYCDIADFMAMCRLVGPPETFTKIDHCYWLTQSTAPAIFHALGFEVVSMNVVFQYGQVGFLLRPCEPSAPAGVPEAWIQWQIREIEKVQREWHEYGRTSLGARDWLRRKGYRMKRRISRRLIL